MTAGNDDASAEEDEGDDDVATSDRLERVVVAVSVGFTALLLAFTLWQAAMSPDEVVPTASIEAVEPTPSSDERPERLRVTVRIDNRGGAGLETATVAVDCGTAERTLQFSYVPGNGHKTATVVCPTGTTPTATVESWTEA